MDPNTRALIMGASGGAAAEKIYVEDVFSTWLYTGNASTQTITNGIDLAGEGGLVWTKPRVSATLNDHILVDSERGNFQIQSNTTAANNGIASFNFSATGYTVPSNLRVNESGITYASWTFRKAPGFFDVVTYTGDGVAGRTVAHALGSVPGLIIVKRTSNTGNWTVYHRALGATKNLLLHATNAAGTYTPIWNDTEPTSTVFTVGTDSNVNASGSTYVAYLFAHDAGGFGDSENESVISCGSFVAGVDGYATVNLGWEPQWVLLKNASGVGNWVIYDSMRGIFAGSSDKYLLPNTTNAEGEYEAGSFEPTGFTLRDGPQGATHIYIAIRRGPMKTPESGTEVFAAQTDNQTGNGYYAELGKPVDAWWYIYGKNTTHNTFARTRLTAGNYLFTNATNAETTQSTSFFDNNLGVKTGSLTTNTNNISFVFRRAPGFFDVVAYTGTGVARTVAHNLGVAPELMIVKGRTYAGLWGVYAASVGIDYRGALNTSDQFYSGSSGFWNATVPTSTVFSLGANNSVNGSGYTYIAYLFATCPGVSKCFNYTGTGTTLQINCGFTNGARFVMIKRTDSTGDWYVWDSTRGIISGNDPYLLLNSTAAEVTNTDYIDPYSAGFEISSTAPAAINANGGSYIGLAIA